MYLSSHSNGKISYAVCGKINSCVKIHTWVRQDKLFHSLLTDDRRSVLQITFRREGYPQMTPEHGTLIKGERCNNDRDVMVDRSAPRLENTHMFRMDSIIFSMSIRNYVIKDDFRWLLFLEFFVSDIKIFSNDKLLKKKFCFSMNKSLDSILQIPYFLLHPKYQKMFLYFSTRINRHLGNTSKRAF